MSIIGATLVPAKATSRDRFSVPGVVPTEAKSPSKDAA